MSATLFRQTRARQTRAHWSGRHVVVTGGTSGIGLATTDLLLGAGASVTAIGRTQAGVQRLAEQYRPGLTAVAADVSQRDQLVAAIDAGRDAHGPVGALICSAGIVKPGYFTDLTDADLRAHMEVNYFGTVHAIRACLADLRTRPGASITCISSAAGFLGVFGYGAYSPSKFAVRGLCEVLRQELRPLGISVTGVYPADVDTPMLAQESLLKPAELRALSSGANAMSAVDVARALLAGSAAGRAVVLPGLSTKGLYRLVGLAPRTVARLMDRTIAGARL